ncbi:MAG TPA: hypothetical protein VLU25_18175 [Acidobacteriota bacterium]|nr:hypothetical protein [Acidobacteriota bacterium]
MAYSPNLERTSTHPQSETGACPAEHAVYLPAGGWRLWRTLALRGAGFSASLVLQLAAPETAAAADRYSKARRERAKRLEEVLEEVREMSAQAREDRSRIRALRRLRRRLRRGKVDLQCRQPDQRALAAAIEEEENALRAFQSAHEEDAQQLIGRLADIAADPRFQEAAVWQTGRALEYVRKSLGRAANQKQREAIEFIALLVQRYAVKNDTCGFFGPCGWARLDDRQEAYLRMDTSPQLITRRNVYFEGWTIDALADLLNQQEDARRWAAPRLATGAWRGPDGFYVPVHGRVEMSSKERTVAELCDGSRSADAIARRLLEEGRIENEQEVFQILESLQESKLVVWRFEVAPQLHPDREFQVVVDRIGDSDLHRRYNDALGQIVEARDQVAACAGQPEKLGEALRQADETFSRLTGLAPTRRPGIMYAGRNLMYEDCLRAGQVTFGQGLLRELGPPLSIVLDGAHWLLGEAARELRGCLRRCYADLRDQVSEEEIDAERFLNHAKSDYWLKDVVKPLLDELQERFQSAWEEVLGDPSQENGHRMVYDLRETARRAQRVFGDPDPVWTVARQLSPDVMVSADGPRGLQEGDFEFFLGELHCGNTLTWSALAAQHPNLDELLDALGEDTAGETCVLRQVPRRGWLARANLMLVHPSHWRYETGEDMGSLPGCRPLPAGMLLATPQGPGGDILFQARDGSFECDALEVFSDWLLPPINEILSNIRPHSRHTRRATLGRLTIVRERWDLTTEDMPFLEENERDRQFAAVRAWAQRHGMPRWVFFKTPAEPKPCYLDFDSPAYVEIFARFVKLMEDGQTVKVVEMKPQVDETWLRDGHDTSYTSELRIVAQRRQRTEGGR